MDGILEKGDVVQRLKQIVDERDYYKREHAIATQAILELKFEIGEQARLLDHAHERLRPYEPEPSVPSRSPKGWIWWWRTSPENFPEVVEAENLWSHGHRQAALNKMPPILERKDLGIPNQVNARLLYSAILLSSSSNLNVALSLAEEALHLAFTSQLYELAGKAQFHRGFCYSCLDEPAKAYWCFVLASHVEDYRETIKDCRLDAEKAINALPLDDPGRSLSDFNWFNLANMGLPT